MADLVSRQRLARSQILSEDVDAVVLIPVQQLELPSGFIKDQLPAALKLQSGRSTSYFGAASRGRCGGRASVLQQHS